MTARLGWPGWRQGGWGSTVARGRGHAARRRAGGQLDHPARWATRWTWPARHGGALSERCWTTAAATVDPLVVKENAAAAGRCEPGGGPCAPGTGRAGDAGCGLSSDAGRRPAPPPSYTVSAEELAPLVSDTSYRPSARRFSLQVVTEFRREPAAEIRRCSAGRPSWRGEPRRNAEQLTSTPEIGRDRGAHAQPDRPHAWTWMRRWRPSARPLSRPGAPGHACR